MKEAKDFDTFYSSAINIANEIRSKYSFDLITTQLVDNCIEENCYYKLGILSDNVVKSLGGKSNILFLSLSNLVKNISKHPEITKEIYLLAIDFINSSESLFIDKNNLKIFKTYENNLYEIIIKATQNKFENYMLSIHYSYARRNKNKKG